MEYVHVRRLAFIIRQVVGRHFIVIRLQTLQHRSVAEPPVLVCHAHRRVTPYAGLHALSDIAAKRELVILAQGRIDVCHQHLPPRHARILLLVRMQCIVPFRVVTPVIGNQPLVAEVLPVLVSVVLFVADLLVLRAPLALAVETPNTHMVLVDDAALLRTVQRLGIFFLRVLWGAEVYEIESHARLKETFFVLAHQVVLHLYSGGDSPTVTFYQTEHVTETVHYQHLVFLASVARTYHALAYYIVGIVGMDTLLGVFQFAGKINVVHRDLRQGELSVMAVHVRHLLMHKRSIAHKGVLNEQLVVRLVQHVVDGAFAQFLRVAALVGEVIGVEHLAGFRVPHVTLTADKGDIHLMHVAVIGFVLLYGKAQYQPLGLIVHFPGALVAKLAAYQALISVLLVLVHLLAEAQRAGRKVVSVFLA